MPVSWPNGADFARVVQCCQSVGPMQRVHHPPSVSLQMVNTSFLARPRLIWSFLFVRLLLSPRVVPRPINHFQNKVVKFASNICWSLCVLCHHTLSCFMIVSRASIWREQWARLRGGIAIFSKKGEIITIGCNEVPKAGGGSYWIDDDLPIFRDIEIGVDANQRRKAEIIYDLVERMGQEGFLSKVISRLEILTSRSRHRRRTLSYRIFQLMDIIEFGRMIHAEMLAISDAARLGRATKNATLYCTTFPCHLCAKHIVAAGIDRVVFLEPYPKSYAQKLHEDSITFETDIPDMVFFQPFMGISPRRYRDIFEKRAPRKEDGGKAKEWFEVGRLRSSRTAAPPTSQMRSPQFMSRLRGLEKVVGRGQRPKHRPHRCCGPQSAAITGKPAASRVPPL